MGVKEEGNTLHLFPPDTFQYVYNIQNLTTVMNRINGIKNKTINSGLREPNFWLFVLFQSYSVPQEKYIIATGQSTDNVSLTVKNKWLYTEQLMLMI